MVVHVGEIHTDVRPAGEQAANGNPSAGAPAGPTGDETWRESRGRTEWLAARTAAEGFDD